MTRGHDILGNMGPAARRRNAELLAKEGIFHAALPLYAPEPEITIRQRRRSTSKLQLDFYSYLRATSDRSDIILEEAFAIEIANGCHYTPDAWKVTPASHSAVKLMAYEVKGRHAWDDAIVKLKVVARSFPWISFFLVCRSGRLGPWQQRLVLP